MARDENKRLMADAVRHFQAGALQKTMLICQHLLSVDTRHADALGLLGVAEGQAGDLDAAIGHLREAVALVPDNPPFHANLAFALIRAEHMAEGTVHYARAAELAPDDGRIIYDYACALQRQGQMDEAETGFRRAIALQPHFPNAYSNLGDVLRHKGRPGEAYACFEKALQLNPDLQEAYVNAGLVQLEQGRFPEALQYYNRALALDPDDSEARVNRAIWYFLQGDLKTAWPEYEWRWQNKGKVRRNFSFPPWDGTPLTGKTLLFYAEQGIGDELMFASCIPELITSARRVVVDCEPRLAPLFARSFAKAIVHGGFQMEPAGWTKDIETIDFQVACGSAPRYLRPDIDHFPARAGYLIADEQARQIWRERFGQLGKGLKVGISWRGGTRGVNSATRSIPLDLWPPVFAVSGVHFVNLQYGECAQELEDVWRNLGCRISDWPESDPIANLDDFAAQIAALDLVISVDNSTVHMAGGLGVPVWTLLSYVPDWRWMLDRVDSPWYPNMRLFRPPEPGNWKTVIREAAGHLRTMVSEHKIL